MGCFYVAKCRKNSEQGKLKSMKSYNSLYENQPALLPNPQTVGVWSHHQQLLSSSSQLSVSELDLHQVRRGAPDAFPSCTVATLTTATGGVSSNSSKSSPETPGLVGHPVPLPLPQEARFPLPLPMQRSSSVSSSRPKPLFESSKIFQSFTFGSEPQPLPLPSQLEVTSLRVFRHEEILSGCENFSPSHLLRDTRIGPMYRCAVNMLGSNKKMEVAVTRMRASNIGAASECLATFETLARVQSPFVNKFLGFCMPKETGGSCSSSEWLLVCEHVESESLETLLRKQDQSALDWPARMKIALGVAGGLEYLKERSLLQGCFDCDFDLCNIQVDKNCNPKLSDYGLQHFLKPDAVEDTHISMDFGRSAPEKVAVKNFGKLLLALVLARKYLDKILFQKNEILQTIRPLLNDAARLGSLLDPALKGKPISGSMKKVVNLACRCLHESAELRPQLQEVLEVLHSIQDVKKMKSLNSFKAPMLTNAASRRNLPKSTSWSTKTTDQKMFELPQLVVADEPMEDRKTNEQVALGSTQIPVQPRFTNAVASIEPTRNAHAKLNYRPLQKHTQMPNLRCGSSLERHELGMNFYRANLFQTS